MGWIDDLEEGNVVVFDHHKKCKCKACEARRQPPEPRTGREVSYGSFLVEL